MDELILLALQGTASPRQLEELRAWRRASAEHERRYREVAAVWRLAGEHTEIDESAQAPASERILSSTLARRGRRGVRRWPVRVFAVSAALIAGILIGRHGLLMPEAGPATEAEFHTGSGEMATAALEDGTVVRMAPATRLRVSMGAGGREVWLEGRAFFAVARDARRPFRVRTAEGEATVLGTRFEVDTRHDDLRLLVVDGRVSVSSGAQNVELSAGEMARAAPGTVPSVSTVPDPDALLDWMGAFIAFESTPLHRVVRELRARLGIEIEIADSSIAQRTVTAWFGEEERDEIIRIICRTAAVECLTVGAVVRIGP